MELVVARTFRQRLLGLALRRRPPPGRALLIPRCRAVHTFGMRFPLDLVWLDAAGEILAIDGAVPPWRMRSCPDAFAVVEVPARPARGSAGVRAALEECAPMPEQHRNRLAVALDPRQPIYRDTYNEYFVLALSAGGAAAGTQVPLYIVMAITGIWPVGIFVAACVVFELAVVFGLARPQMKPNERVGWALLWGALTAALAFAFYHLVATTTL